MRLRTLVLREIFERKSQLLTSFLAILLGITVIVSIKNISYYSEKAVAREMDSLGANVLVLPKSSTLQDYYAADMQGVEAFKADPQYAKGTEVVTLNPTEDVEQPFLKALQVDPKTTTAVTLLVMPPGSPVARFAGAVTKGQIEAGVKAAASNCGPNCNCH